MSDNKAETSRNIQFMILSALGQIFVVAGHCGGGISLFFDIFPIYQFHVPLFIFISGYFYKSKNEESVKSLVSYVKKKFFSLIVPLYVWNLIYGFLAQIIRRKGMEYGQEALTYESLLISPLNNGHQFILNLCSWFIAPLFFAELINILYRFILDKVLLNIKNKEFIKDLLVCGSFAILGVVDLAICINKPEAISLFWKRQLLFLTFYGIGTFYKNFLEKYDRLPTWIYLLIVLSIQIAVTMYQGGMHTYSLATMDSFTIESGKIRPLIVMLLGIAFWLRISRELVPVLGSSRIVNAISRNGMSIVMHQFLGIMFVKTIFFYLNKTLGFFPSFEAESYKLNLWYYYYPKDVKLWVIVYLIGGIAIPILIGTVVNLVGLWKSKWETVYFFQ